MNSIKLNGCAIFSVVALVTGLVIEANAQQAWSPDYYPSCSERGGCQHGNDSLELNPYGPSAGYGNGSASTRIPYRDSLLASYQSSLGDDSGSCGYGGTCRQSDAGQNNYGGSTFDSGGRCPYQQRQFEQMSHGPRSTYGVQRTYGGGYERDPNFGTRQNDAFPSRRRLESYQQAPAGRRLELRTSPSFGPRTSDGRNESRPQSRDLIGPPTSTQIRPPPALPPQPLASNSRHGSLRVMPPTTGRSSQQSTDEPAGHDHLGHDHSGHNH